MKKLLFLFCIVQSGFLTAQLTMSTRLLDIGISALSEKSLKGVSQDFVVTGQVTDNEGLPLGGANILEKGTSNGIQTDFDGNFTITVSGPNAVLVVSYIGFAQKEIPVGNQTTMVINLEESASGLDEVVVVGYGSQRKGSITGSISTIKSEELVRAPIASVSNLLAGQLPGLKSIQLSGQPGADAAGLSIRGFGSPLVIVDGVETSFNNIDANQIESISILKDGSASIYGSRAGNGVLLVTTKRGKLGKPVITLNSSLTYQGVTRTPKPVSSGQYSEMAREQWIQSGNPEATAPYTLDEIDKFYNGTDPQYPNTNWYDVLTRDWAPQYLHNISVRGGSEKIKYFGLIGFLDQETMWVKSDGNYKRYNFQSNIDAEITEDLSLRLDISGKVEDRNFTARDWSTDIWGDFWLTSPTVPASFPDATKIPNTHVTAGIAPASISTNRDIWGYRDSDDFNFNGTLSLDYKIPFVKGLSAKTFVNYLRNDGIEKFFNKSFETYDYDYASDAYTIGAVRSNPELSIRNGNNRTITSQTSLNYATTINESHSVSALAMYEEIDVKSQWTRARRDGFLTNEIDQLFAGSTENMIGDGAGAEMGRQSFIGRVTYGYKNKYLLESAIRADASAKFSEVNRWGYFPSVSLGWVVSEENFIKEDSFLNQLKLRASYGESGNDNVGNFQYLSGYRFDDTYIFQGTSVEQGLISTGLANPNLTWEKLSIYNVGVDFQLFNSKLYGELEGFYRQRAGIPATKNSTLPTSFGANLPQENINSQNNRGVELLLGTRGHSKDFSWDVMGTLSWSRSKWDHFEEPEYTDPDQKRIDQKSGQWTDRIFGYQSDGLFTSQEEIEALEFDQDQVGNVSLRPGDVKYVDTNDDGVLDWKDRVLIADGGFLPHWILGFNVNLKYKQFDFSAFFQGGFNSYANVNLNTKDQVSPAARYELRWTEENNNPNALEPRLGGSPLNDASSDYRIKSASYLRLKSLSIGYNVPTEWAQKSSFSKIRLYIAGTNLFTFDKLKDFNVDPELPSGSAGLYYPQQRTLSVGVNVSL
ncbi:TonB-dependent receptor [Arenibacter sp. F26102]|uniref:SusC/RagA family TonB-linked outer membrane protein n=1 Tax=Arenibacter sp. F26102 TaxID=2926416 RepID=UPI001FF2139C|nr:TonB-dependent receptor [Arenibacter sp. F26102]MCK0148225.1 TonB-dependent receptor [Arenibacter sp. F26102]